MSVISFPYFTYWLRIVAPEEEILFQPRPTKRPLDTISATVRRFPCDAVVLIWRISFLRSHTCHPKIGVEDGGKWQDERLALAWVCPWAKLKNCANRSRENQSRSEEISVLWTWFDEDFPFSSDRQGHILYFCAALAEKISELWAVKIARIGSYVESGVLKHTTNECALTTTWQESSCFGQLESGTVFHSGLFLPQCISSHTILPSLSLALSVSVFLCSSVLTLTGLDWTVWICFGFLEAWFCVHFGCQSALQHSPLASY